MRGGEWLKLGLNEEGRPVSIKGQHVRKSENIKTFQSNYEKIFNNTRQEDKTHGIIKERDTQTGEKEMKAEKEQAADAWVPITITLETKREADDLWHVFNASEGKSLDFYTEAKGIPKIDKTQFWETLNYLHYVH